MRREKSVLSRNSGFWKGGSHEPYIPHQHIIEGKHDIAFVISSINFEEPLNSASGFVTDGSMSGYAGQKVVFTADIDCSGVEWIPAGTMNLNDMGNYSCMFQGVFDGQGHKISNVTFESDYPICGTVLLGDQMDSDRF